MPGGSLAANIGSGAAMGTSISPGWGTAIGAGVGLLGGLLGGGGQTDTSGAMKHLYDQRLLDTIAKFFPELMQARDMDSGLYPMLAGRTNQTFQNVSGGFNDLLAQHGLLGSGMQAGGNAALGLARGSQLNQDQVTAFNSLLQNLFQASNFAQGLGQARAGVRLGGQQQPSQLNQGILGALQGAGFGALGSSQWGGQFGLPQSQQTWTPFDASQPWMGGA